MSNLEERLIDKMISEGLPKFEREYRFHQPKPGEKKRMWRTDFAFVRFRVAVEVEGGTFARPVYCQNCHSKVMTRTKLGKLIPLNVGGRHNTGAGMEADIEKYNQLAIDGWMLIRVSSPMIKNDSGKAALDAIKAALKERGWKG